jgi:hypothetical protein
MTETYTPNLGLPVIDADVTQKYVLVNEALAILDFLAMPGTQSAALTTPPLAPEEGQAWIVAAGATDEWDLEDGNIALWTDGQWKFIEPKDGWSVYDVASGSLLVYTTATGWSPSFAAGMSGLFGAGTAAAPSMAFSVDTDTGIYRAAANKLGVATQGVSRLIIDDNGVAAFSGTTDSSSSSTGAITTAGGIGVAKSISVGGTTASTSTTTGAITTAGGIGAAKDVYIGGVFAAPGTGTVSLPGFTFANDLNTGIYRSAADTLGIATGGTDSIKFGPSNNAIIGGGTLAASTTLQAVNPPGTGQASLFGFYHGMLIPSTATATQRMFYSNPSTVAAAFSISNILSFNADFGTLGAGSTVSLFEGFRVSAVTGPATIRGFRGLVAASGTNNYNCYMDGSAPNLFSGDTSFNSGSAATSTTTGAVQATGGIGVSGAGYFGSGVFIAGNVPFTYAAGSGGAVTQLTSKATGVSLNSASGRITMNNAALGAGVSVQFTLTNTVINAGDVIDVNHISGGTLGSYVVQCASTTGNSAIIRVTNNAGGPLSEAIVIAFAIMRTSAT